MPPVVTIIRGKIEELQKERKPNVILRKVVLASQKRFKPREVELYNGSIEIELYVISMEGTGWAFFAQESN